MKKAISLVLGAALLAGCGWTADGPARLEEEYPTPPPPAADKTCDDLAKIDGQPSGRDIDVGETSCMGLLQGRWAVRLVERGTMAPLGEVWDISLNDLFIAELSEDKKAVELHFCDQIAKLVAPSGALNFGETRVPAKLKSVLHDRPISIPIVDGSLSARDLTWLWGLKSMTDPVNDPLPTEASDPRVFDEDTDGNPGVTLTISFPAGDRYMVRRALWSFDKSTTSADNAWITGSLAFDVDEVALGATDPSLMTVAPITSRTSCNSYQMRCVGPDYGCEQLAQDYLDLFADAPK
jgi:hypothetical protein